VERPGPGDPSTHPSPEKIIHALTGYFEDHFGALASPLIMSTTTQRPTIASGTVKRHLHIRAVPGPWPLRRWHSINQRDRLARECVGLSVKTDHVLSLDPRMNGDYGGVPEIEGAL
jgi:hypothetical protein